MKSSVGKISAERPITTESGQYRQDRSGLWHYHYSQASGTVSDAARDAIAHHPGNAAWFWFNGTFSPIIVGDDTRNLVERWNLWRFKFQDNPKSLPSLIEEFTPRCTGESKTRYWLSVSGLPWQEATQQQFIQAEQSAGFYHKKGCGPVATESFSAKGISGRVTRGEISEAAGYDKEFVRIANGS